MGLIRKSFELEVQTKVKMLIYGQAGTGKTTLALSAPKPLLFDFDNGINRTTYEHRTDTVQVSSWEMVEDVFAKEDLSGYETLIFDTGGKLLDYMTEYIIRKNSKMGRSSGQLTMQGFGERKQMFRQLCKKIMLMNKHLIFVAHRDTQKNNEEIRYVPLFGGSSYDDLVTDLDLVGYLETIGKKRVITFDPSDRNDGKNTCNLPSQIELPNVVDAKTNTGLKNSFLTDFVISPYISNLQKIQQIGIEFQNLINSIKTDIAEFVVDGESATKFVLNIDNAYQHIGTSKATAKQLIIAKAKELGLKWNKETNQYEHTSEV